MKERPLTQFCDFKKFISDKLIKDSIFDESYFNSDDNHNRLERMWVSGESPTLAYSTLFEFFKAIQRPLYQEKSAKQLATSYTVI